ncbi:hypothetical protein Tco_0226576 [Tanacetum coccineum]
MQLKKNAVLWSLYTRECCSIGSLENKILVPEPDSSPCCAKCGTPVDGPYYRGCALLRKKFEEDLLTYCVENGIFQDSQDTFESSDDNTNVINALQEPIVVNQDPWSKFKKRSKLTMKNNILLPVVACFLFLLCRGDLFPLGDIIARYSTSKAITPDLQIEEPDNSLSMGDKHLDTTPSIENLVPIPSEFEGISDDTSDVPNYRPFLEKFAGELALLLQFSPGIVEANFNPNDDTSSDDDSFENIEYVEASPLNLEYNSLEKVNDVDQEEKEFGIRRYFSIQRYSCEKLLNVVFHFFEESDTSLSHSDNSLPEFETFSHHTEETRSGSTTTHANNSLPEYDSFLFEIEPDQGDLTSVVISNNLNDPLLELLV